MQNRPLALRAFDHAGMLLDADLAQDETLAPTIERMLADQRVAYLHAHNAKHGCFAARVDRVAPRGQTLASQAVISDRLCV